jgi:hypothetical protein
MKNPSTAIISTTLLVLFLVPYIWKLKEPGLIVVLCLGVALVIYDFFASKKEKSHMRLEHPSYDSEST